MEFFNRLRGSGHDAEAREFQILILGASGFTGEYVVEDLVNYINRENVSLKWAVSGRNEAKIRSILDSVAVRIGTNLDAIPIVHADVGDEASLNAAAARTKVVINCVGPYRYFGEPVVKACLANNAHYVDITGEPQFMETMQLKYHREAEEKNLYIVSACGFDSVPCDIGVNFTRDNFDGVLNSVESYLLLNNGGGGISGNSTTWDCAVDGFAHADELKRLRKQLFTELNYKDVPKSKWPLVRKNLFSFTDDRASGWGVPFPGSDRSVVKRSQMSNHLNYQEMPTEIETYVVHSLKETLLYFFVGLILMSLKPFKFGRSLLKRYPDFLTLGLFKKGGPAKEEVESGSFFITFIGRGWNYSSDPKDNPEQSSPYKEIVTRIEGPHPGYPTAALCANQAAITILEESSLMASKGGVLTPGAAFRKTSYAKRLTKNGLKLYVVKKQ